MIDRANPAARESGEAPGSSPGSLPRRSSPVFLEERNEDLGTTACPLTAFSALGPEGEGAAARRANGDSALLVAWDLPDGPGRYGSGDYYAHCGRGAFGTSLWRQEEFFQKGVESNAAFR